MRFLMLSAVLIIACKSDDNAKPAAAPSSPTPVEQKRPAPPDAAVTKATADPCVIKEGIKIGTTLDELEAAYGDDLISMRESDNDPAGDYLLGPEDKPCITFTVKFVDDAHRVTKIDQAKKP